MVYCLILINVFFFHPGWPCLVCTADANTHSDHSLSSQSDDGFQSSIQPQSQTVRPTLNVLKNDHVYLAYYYYTILFDSLIKH